MYSGNYLQAFLLSLFKEVEFLFTDNLNANEVQRMSGGRTTVERAARRGDDSRGVRLREPPTTDSRHLRA
ncbi:hypothetical protein J6590_004318 [Homalodisca vitripennis]|nr:hypothetical protein J6590_004318 [Homalodisca vitripennis]